MRQALKDKDSRQGSKREEGRKEVPRGLQGQDSGRKAGGRSWRG